MSGTLVPDASLAALLCEHKKKEICGPSFWVKPNLAVWNLSRCD